MLARQRSVEVGPVEFWHLDIAQDEVIGPLSQPVQRKAPVPDHLHLMIVEAEEVRQHLGDVRVIVHQEHPLPSNREPGRRRLRALDPRLTPKVDRQVDEKHGAAVRFALEVNRPAVRLDDAAAEGQPQPGALPRRFRGEERLEDPGLNRSGNARARVGDLELDPRLPGIEPGAEPHSPRRWRRAHRLVGIGHQVHHDLMKLMGIDPDRRKRGIQDQADLDAVDPQRVGKQLDRLLRDLVQRRRLALHRLLPSQREEILHDPAAALRGLGDLVRARGERPVAGRLPEEGGLPDHDRQGVVQLVRHAREQLTHGRHFFGLQELRRPLPDGLLQPHVLVLKLTMQAPSLQQVSDPEEHLDGVEGLDHEVLGAHRQRPAPGLGRDVRGEDQDRGVRPFGDEVPELLQHGESVRVGHEQIQKEQIGLELLVQRHGPARVGRARDIRVAVLLEQALQEAHVGRLVIDDQEPGPLEGFLRHRPPTPHSPASGPGRGGTRGRRWASPGRRASTCSIRWTFDGLSSM